ncbi:hypothetical protein [Tepidimonas sp.]|uniref:hypothetical protein n=1 Tax=Tepidimonas sp. TaxID=2002775 RepID=UPI00391A3A81
MPLDGAAHLLESEPSPDFKGIKTLGHSSSSSSSTGPNQALISKGLRRGAGAAPSWHLGVRTKP